MKRRILVTALALLLALGALVTLNSSVSRTALPIEMQVLTSGRQQRGTGTDSGLPYRAG